MAQNKNIDKLIEKGILSVDEAKNLSNSAAIAFSTDNVYKLVIDKFLTVDEAKNLSNSAVIAFSYDNVYKLVIGKFLTVDEAKNLSNSAVIAFSTDNVYKLVIDKFLTVDEAKNLSDSAVIAFSYDNVYKLVIDKFLTVDEMKNLSVKSVIKLADENFVNDLKKVVNENLATLKDILQHENPVIYLEKIFAARTNARTICSAARPFSNNENRLQEMPDEILINIARFMTTNDDASNFIISNADLEKAISNGLAAYSVFRSEPQKDFENKKEINKRDSLNL